jgi:PP-loop superfamily ATP-utilizing enzyme
MSRRGAAAREAQATALLTELGILGATVEAAGHEDEIALVRTHGATADRLLDEHRAEVTERIKGLGFRYVALDLGPPP